MNREKQSARDLVAPDIQEQIIRYLLDEMDQTERTDLEEELLRTPEFFDTIASTEDDLIMRFVRGDLKDLLLSRFNEIYMNSPSKRTRIESARALRRAVLNSPKRRRAAVLRNPLLAAAAAAAILLVVAALSVLWRDIPRQTQPRSGVSQVSFSLEPGLTRSSAGIQIALPSGVREVSLRLTVPNVAQTESYRAILETPERPVAWTGDAIPTDAGLVATVPADVLSPGDYTLQLQARGENVATYYFRVAK